MNTYFKIGDEVLLSQEALETLDDLGWDNDMSKVYKIKDIEECGDCILNGWAVPQEYLIKYNRNVLRENIYQY